MLNVWHFGIILKGRTRMPPRYLIWLDRQTAAPSGRREEQVSFLNSQSWGQKTLNTDTYELMWPFSLKSEDLPQNPIKRILDLPVLGHFCSQSHLLFFFLTVFSFECFFCRLLGKWEIISWALCFFYFFCFLQNFLFYYSLTLTVQIVIVNIVLCL